MTINITRAAGLGFLLLLASLFLFDGDGVQPAAAAPVFKLPWQPGLRMFALQGPNQGSHKGFSSKYAYDFVPAPFSGQTFIVRAARTGRVVKVVQQYANSPDCDPSYNAEANYVLLDHGDGLGTLYLHLTQNSVIPKVGAYVNQGDPLGLSGHSGYICGPPHLHFTVLDIKTWQSLDIPFTDADTLRDSGRPRTSQWYVADAAARLYSVNLPYLARRGTR